MENIVFVTRVLSSGGAEKVLSILANNFAEKGIKVTIITMENSDTNYTFHSEITIVNIGKVNGNAIKRKFAEYSKLRHIIKEIKPDLVLSMPEDIGIYVIAAMIGTGIPVVVSERNNPWVMPNKKISRILRKLLYPRLNGIIFQTKGASNFFSKKIRNKGIVLPNPLELDDIPLPYKGEREKTVIGAGRLDKQKNFPLLIDAFQKFQKEHSEYKLIIYGEGPERDYLETYAKDKLNDTSFDLPGRINNLPEMINKASVFVLSSDYEGVPNVVIEAMAMGVPCVSTDCAPGGAAELIDDGVNGFIVPVGDVDMMSKRIAELVENKDLANEFSSRSLRVKTIYESKNVCDRWLKYLSDCIKTN